MAAILQTSSAENVSNKILLDIAMEIYCFVTWIGVVGTSCREIPLR